MMAEPLKDWLNRPRKPLAGAEAKTGRVELDRLVKAEKKKS